MGPRIARKHVSWYLQTVPDSESFRKEFNRLETAEAQEHKVQQFFDQIATTQNIKNQIITNQIITKEEHAA